MNITNRNLYKLIPAILIAASGMSPTPATSAVVNKSSQFDAALADVTTKSDTAGDSYFAEMIRRQRAALDTADATGTANEKMRAALASNKNPCDTALRECMAKKCGDDFGKCSGDTDMTWGDKMDACRRNTTCTGNEFNLFNSEIKADRDLNARMASYNKIISCGDEYNTCIVNECGATYSKCLGKSAGDAAINKCKSVANKCRESDGGLAARIGDVFANLRVGAEKRIATDTERLYELRDAMRNACQTLGAMFDERTFSCVYTVNFFANNSTTPYASQKAYAGSTFSCSPDWFGIDVTTFKENAYRLTREQTSASSALMGSGVGVAAGAISSGAISRAIDTKKAKNALKDAEEKHEKDFGNGTTEKEDKKTERQVKRDAQKAEREEKAEAKRTKQQQKEWTNQAAKDKENAQAAKSKEEAEKQIQANMNPTSGPGITVGGVSYKMPTSNNTSNVPTLSNIVSTGTTSRQ